MSTEAGRLGTSGHLRHAFSGPEAVVLFMTSSSGTGIKNEVLKLCSTGLQLAEVLESIGLLDTPLNDASPFTARQAVWLLHAHESRATKMLGGDSIDALAMSYQQQYAQYYAKMVQYIPACPIGHFMHAEALHMVARTCKPSAYTAMHEACQAGLRIGDELVVCLGSWYEAMLLMGGGSGHNTFAEAEVDKAMHVLVQAMSCDSYDVYS